MMQIGRAEGLTVSRFIQSGDRVQVSATFVAETHGAAVALMFQINGLVAGDLVPLVDDLNEERTGYYRVRSARANLTRPVTGAIVRCQIDLAWTPPVEGESLFQVALRPNTQAVTDAEAMYRVGWPTPNVDGNSTWVSVEGKFGAIRVVDDTVDNAPAELVRSYDRPLADFYVGAATVEFELDGVWYPAVNDRVPQGAAVRLSNGAMRVRPTVFGGRPAVGVQQWDQASDAWLPEKEIRGDHVFNVPPSVSAPFFAGISVNSQYEVTARWVWGELVSYEFTLQRGALHVEVAVDNGESSEAVAPFDLHPRLSFAESFNPLPAGDALGIYQREDPFPAVFIAAKSGSVDGSSKLTPKTSADRVGYFAIGFADNVDPHPVMLRHYSSVSAVERLKAT